MNGWIKLHRKLLNNDALFRSGATFPVFCWLLLMADRDGVVTVGRNQMASWLKIKPSTVYLALKRLENLTIIRLKPNNKMTTVYICNWDTYQKEPDSKITTKQQQDNTKQEVRIENKNNTNVEEIFKHYQDAFKAPKTLLTPGRIRLLESRIQDCGVELLRQAITNTSRSPWHRGENDRHWKADLDFIIRKPEQVERLAGLELQTESKFKRDLTERGLL